ncbi:MAG TPA: single-stranded DNA-binding protein, partial [Sphaerochaeta sp.]|nr:single-stranded DNA-binding protein [Sphaerochaeta sp.]
MANDMNMVALIGRLTRDAEVTFTSGGMAIAKFSLAVNKRKKVGDSWEDEAHFFGCTLFGKSAEAIEGWLKKGKQVAVQGELRQSRWEQDGQNRSKIEIVANSVQLLASPGDNK